MKKIILRASIALAFISSLGSAYSQSLAVDDQNPNYAVSRDKYMKIADSLTEWHSTTPQETYKAIDYLEDKRIAREERKTFRRELRMERARRYSDWGYSDYSYNNYHRYYNGYGYNRYNRHYRNRSFNYNHFWNAVPLALTLGLLCR